MKTKTRIIVRNYHIDHFGHVNHARFVELLEEARWRYLDENNLLPSIHEVGAFHVVAEIQIQYRRPARIGDILLFETEIKRRSGHRFWVEQRARIHRSNTIALEALVINVFVDKLGRPRKIDRDILDIWPDLAAAEQSQPIA